MGWYITNFIKDRERYLKHQKVDFNMEIRFATINDFEKFFPIKMEFLNEYGIFNKSKEFIKKEYLKDLKGAVIIALENEMIVGYIAGIIKNDGYDEFGHIEEVFVKKEFRWKGISSKLKDKFLEFLKGKEIKLCRLDVSPNNPARNIYRSWGFKIDKFRMSLNLW